MLNHPIGRLRIVAFIEGMSYLVLLAIAMPLKYFLDMPQAVKIVGSLHGLLFVLYVLAVIHVTFAHRWTVLKVLFALLAAFIPFGNFVLDSRLLKNSR